MQDQLYDAEIYHHRMPERYLWQAVLMQAWEDINNKPKNLAARYEQQKAIEFFSGKSSGYYRICDAAGIDAEYLHKKIMQLMQERGVIA